MRGNGTTRGRRGREHRQQQGPIRRPDRERGQSIVELVIILPVLLLLVMVALDFGRLFQGWVVLNNAARMGANYAALHPEAWGTPGNSARQASYQSLVMGARDDAEVSLTGCSSSAVPAPAFPNGTDTGDYAEVVLDCGFVPLTPIIGNVFAGGVPLNVTARAVFPIRTGAVAGAPKTPPPYCLANFSWAARGGSESLTVDFTDTTPPTSASWIWDFGDGLGSALQDPSHDYASSGSYTVTLSSSSNGISCTPFVDVVTVVEPPPSPDPGASPAPSASPSPSPTPEPPCTVPSFIGTKKNQAAGAWTSAGFTTPITYDPDPNGNWTIEAQSLVGGQDAPCNTPLTLSPDPIPTPAP